ncbi:hypothetical protein ACP70R_010924 [Stipagrostis hirtigluma subsp. patula]
MASSSRAPAPRDWAALPRDVQWEVFRRLPHADILCGAGLVCASWRRLATDEPMLWRRIDIASKSNDDGESSPDPSLLAMARAAVDRSAGRCESFRGPADCHLLAYLAASAPSLRSLHVTSFFRLPRDLVGRVVPELAALERLVLSRGITTFAMLHAFLDHCPRLQLLDAKGCYMGGPLELRLITSFMQKTRAAEIVALPRWLLPKEPMYMKMLAEDGHCPVSSYS